MVNSASLRRQIFSFLIFLGSRLCGNSKSLCLPLLLAGLVSAGAAQASGSYTRFYGSLEGLRAGEIAALAQDQAGFIWIGSQGGLLRFDGNRFVRFAAQQIPRGVNGLWWDAHSGLLIETERGRALLENNGRVQTLIGPDNKPVTDLESAAFDERHQLWALLGQQLWRRNAAGRWQVIPAERYEDEPTRRLVSLERGVALITYRSAWRLNTHAQAHLLLRAPNLFAAAGGGRHPLWLASYANGSLWRQQHGRFVTVRHIVGRVLDMRYRGDTLWLSVDRYLLAFAPDGAVHGIDVNHGLASGGPLLVDREGSLWVGTFVGLQQYPEPDTRQWTELDGLPWQHAYDITAAAGRIWVNTWGGQVYFDVRRGLVQPHRMGQAKGVLCADREQRLWFAAQGSLRYWQDGRYVTVSRLGTSDFGLGGCMPAEDGGEWLATNAGVFYADASAQHVVRVLAPVEPAADYFTDLAWQSNDGNLWATGHDHLCHYRLNGLHAQSLGCTQQPFEYGASRVAEIAPGRYWISTRAGLFLFDGSKTELLAGNMALPGERFRIIEPAASGGYWAAAPGALDRIVPCDDCAAGFKIVESIGAWQGVPTDSALDVVELKSGDLWIAGNRGVFHVPAAARPGPKAPPALLLEDVNVDGRAQALDAPLSMRPGQKQLNLEFAALTFRDRSLLRYRFRNAVDSTWSAPTINPDLQLIAPRPGNYRIFAQASLDGIHWSSSVSYAFSVAPPWYETLWARIALLILFAMLVALAVRLWLEYRLRLERQRVQIAMDLHDELGSTLGSIGMLAGALRHGRLEKPEHHRLLGDISDAVARLSGALRTVVWSMRQPRAGLHQLFTEIGDQAKHLFPGSSPALSVSGPAANGDKPLDPDVRRHVLMVALEAMHNVSRHARAQEVALKLHRLAHDVWQLEVSDDGAGFDTRVVHAGSGVESMRRRARLIRAQLAIYSEPGAGTRITLDFRPHGGRS